MALITVLIIQAISISDPTKGNDELPDIVKIYSFITINMQFQAIIVMRKLRTVSCKKENLGFVKCQTPSIILAIKCVPNYLKCEAYKEMQGV